MKHDRRGKRGVRFGVAKRFEDILHLAVELRIAPTRIAFDAAPPERRIP